MVHEVEDWMLDLDLSNYDILTFDDGLLSQYINYKHFLQFSKPLYFFISTDIVCGEDVKQNRDVVSCSDAHKSYREDKDKSYYMRWSQITEIYNTPNCFIGGHGHTHVRLENKNLGSLYQIIKSECDNMCSVFSDNNITIDSFCFPYNKSIIGFEPYLNKQGIINFFGNGRIPIEIT